MTTRAVIPPLLLVALLALGPVARGAAGPYEETIHLYGSATGGWGTTPGSLATPGPTLQLTAGQPQAFLFHSVDGAEHEFFVDVDGNGREDAGEPTGPEFETSAGTAAEITVNTAGQFAYYCRYHPGTMRGTLLVAASSPAPAPSPAPSPAPAPTPSPAPAPSPAPGPRGSGIAVIALGAAAAVAAAVLGLAYWTRRRTRGASGGRRPRPPA